MKTSTEYHQNKTFYNNGNRVNTTLLNKRREYIELTLPEEIYKNIFSEVKLEDGYNDSNQKEKGSNYAIRKWVSTCIKQGEYKDPMEPALGSLNSQKLYSKATNLVKNAIKNNQAQLKQLIEDEQAYQQYKQTLEKERLFKDDDVQSQETAPYDNKTSLKTNHEEYYNNSTEEHLLRKQTTKTFKKPIVGTEYSNHEFPTRKLNFDDVPDNKIQTSDNKTQTSEYQEYDKTIKELQQKLAESEIKKRDLEKERDVLAKSKKDNPYGGNIDIKYSNCDNRYDKKDSNKQNDSTSLNPIKYNQATNTDNQQTYTKSSIYNNNTATDQSYPGIHYNPTANNIPLTQPLKQVITTPKISFTQKSPAITTTTNQKIDTQKPNKQFSYLDLFLIGTSIVSLIIFIVSIAITSNVLISISAATGALSLSSFIINDIKKETTPDTNPKNISKISSEETITKDNQKEWTKSVQNQDPDYLEPSR